MENYEEDKDRSFGIIFFLVLFFILVLASSPGQTNHNSSSTAFAKQSELVFEAVPGHQNAILCKAVILPELQKNCECSLRNISLNPFSFRNIISDFDRKSAQNYILIQKTILSIGPVLPFRLYFHYHSDKDYDLPVLS